VAQAYHREDAFVLYDTFGFPLEMTTEMAIEQGLKVDTDAFAKEMEKQRERGKQSWKGSISASNLSSMRLLQQRVIQNF
jgi:alanyl-tRNA synthetase